MNLKDSMRKFFGMDEDSAEQYEAASDKTAGNPIDANSADLYAASSQGSYPADTMQKTKAKVIPMSQKNAPVKTQIHVMEPRVYSESQKIADYLLDHQSVLLNFKRMEHEQAVKVIDFVMGTVYALQGDMQQIGEGIFLCTPPNVEITGMEKEEYEEFYRR